MKKAVAVLCVVFMFFSLSLNVLAAEDTSAGTSDPSQQNLIYDVVIEQAGPDKYTVIAEVRKLTGLGLKEAKDIVDGAPKIVAELNNEIEAMFYKSALEAVGAVVRIVSFTDPNPSQPISQQNIKYDVLLKDAGSTKISVIKEIRLITGLSLTDAKRLVDEAPSKVKEDVLKDEAEQIKTRLEGVGASIELVSAPLQPAAQQNKLYNVFITSVVKEAIPQIEASNIRDALIAKGLNAQVKDRSIPGVKTPGMKVELYDVVITNLIEKEADQNIALQTKSKLEGLGITVELVEHISAPTTPAPAQEKSAYDIVLINCGEKKYQVMRVLTEQLGIGYTEAKNLVDSVPCTVKYGVPKDEAQYIKAKLEEQGATIELR